MHLAGARPYFLAAAALVACSSGEPATPPATEHPAPVASGVESLFVVPASLDALAAEHFYDHPWPSDLRRDPDGSIRLTGFFDPNQTALIQTYLAQSKGLLKGFSPVASAYLRFAGAIDPASLPSSPQAALSPGASVQLVDVDPASPERGQRKLVQLHWRKDAGVYWLDSTLAVMPALGWPLRPKNKYAIVVTRALLDDKGAHVAPSADLKEVLGTVAPTPRTQAAHDLYAPAIAELTKAGVAVSEIAHLAVFTTDDPAAELFRVADDVRASVPPPTVVAGSWAQKEQDAAYDVYEARYDHSPNYQAGKLPFAADGDGGGFAFDAAGKPILQGEFEQRFTLVVPNAARCPMPQAGYPIVLYGHGTGGDYRSVVSEQNSVGQALAERCIASMGTDQIFHGTRPGASPLPGYVQILFFNFNNMIAARTNGRQAAVDVVQQARLFTTTKMSVPASVSRTGSAIAFDGSKLSFFGHSQGGLNGSLYLASDSSARGGVLSGSGSLIIIALLEKSQPQPSVAGLVRSLLSLSTPERQAELNVFHPALNLAQILTDTVDPINYMGYLARHPRAGFPPKSVLVTEGIEPSGKGDSYAPPHGIEIGAVAAGLPRLLPGVRPVEEALFGGLLDVAVPPDGLAKNLAGGRASGALSQFVPGAGSDGHFVIFDVPEARAQVAGFCKNLADDPVGKIPPP